MKCGYHYRPEWPTRAFLEDGLNERSVCKRVCERSDGVSSHLKTFELTQQFRADIFHAKLLAGIRCCLGGGFRQQAESPANAMTACTSAFVSATLAAQPCGNELRKEKIAVPGSVEAMTGNPQAR
jgi:hypothetical protein